MKNKKIKFALIGAIILIVAGVAAYYFFDASNYQGSFSKQHTPIEQTPDPESEGDIGATSGSIYILFLGIDRTEERDSWLGIYRTDAISIAKIDLDNKKVKLLSIPRDTYTYVPIEDKLDKINHAYAYGSLQQKGVEESINAVNYLLKKQAINYYFLMDMEPIPGIVDEIGGVKLDVEIDMKDHGADLSKGLQVLNGKQAFDYIHWRYSAGGDIDRIKRQQKFMRTLLKQQRDSGKILDTIKIVLQHRNDIKTDLSLKQIIGLGHFMTEIPDGNVEYSYIPGEGKMIDGVSYWVMDKNETENLLDGFLNS